MLNTIRGKANRNLALRFGVMYVGDTRTVSGADSVRSSCHEDDDDLFHLESMTITTSAEYSITRQQKGSVCVANPLIGCTG